MTSVSYCAPDLGSSPSIPDSAVAQGSSSDLDPSESPQPWLLPPIRGPGQWFVWVQTGTQVGRNSSVCNPWSQHPHQACPSPCSGESDTSLLHFSLLLSHFRWGDHLHTALWGAGAPDLYYLKCIKYPSFSLLPHSPLEKSVSSLLLILRALILLFKLSQ